MTIGSPSGGGGSLETLSDWSDFMDGADVEVAANAAEYDVAIELGAAIWDQMVADARTGKVASIWDAFDPDGLTEATLAKQLDNGKITGANAASIIDDGSLANSNVNTLLDNNNITSTKISDIFSSGNLSTTALRAIVLDSTQFDAADAGTDIDNGAYTDTEINDAVSDSNIDDDKATDVIANTTFSTRDLTAETNINYLRDDFADNKLTNRLSAVNISSELSANEFAQFFRPTYSTGNDTASTWTIQATGSRLQVDSDGSGSVNEQGGAVNDELTNPATIDPIFITFKDVSFTANNGNNAIHCGVTDVNDMASNISHTGNGAVLRHRDGNQADFIIVDSGSRVNRIIFSDIDWSVNHDITITLDFSGTNTATLDIDGTEQASDTNGNAVSANYSPALALFMNSNNTTGETTEAETLESGAA